MYDMPASGSRWGLSLQTHARARAGTPGDIDCHPCVRYCSRHRGCGSEYSNRKKEDLLLQRREWVSDET